MSKFIITAITASVAMGSAAFAAGDYYEGVSKDRAVAVDMIATGSIGDSLSASEQPVAISTGDYYEGVSHAN